MRKLQTPSGYIVEDRPDNGLYLLGDLDEPKRKAEEWAACQVYKMDGLITVEIGYDQTPFVRGDGAEWGSADNAEDAWRYALGAHFGSVDDPEING
jgi:hypothetical protein